MTVSRFGPDAVLARAPDVIGVHVGSVFVLHDPRADRYVRLNRSGELLWARLAEPHTLRALAAGLSQRYELSMARAVTDVTRLAEGLLARGMITIEAAAAGPRGPTPASGSRAR